ncbi:MAG: NAD-dependent epimerase/dehydratase family protein [Acidimicrobiales bacterium]
MTHVPLDARIYVAGHRGLVGSAIVRALAERGHTNVLTATRAELDLRDQAAVNVWFAENNQVTSISSLARLVAFGPTRRAPAEFLTTIS